MDSKNKFDVAFFIINFFLFLDFMTILANKIVDYLSLIIHNIFVIRQIYVNYNKTNKKQELYNYCFKFICNSSIKPNKSKSFFKIFFVQLFIVNLGSERNVKKNKNCIGIFHYDRKLIQIEA